MNGTNEPLPKFDPPANVSDFPSGSSQDQQLREIWSQKINEWTNVAINRSGSDYYFNPLITNIPPDAATAPIGWIAFPNRINVIFAGQSQRERWRLADEGPGGNYTPPGPRGWQDEYCEWSVTRNGDGKITKVMFTCENPEYWLTLFNVDPNKVLSLYQSLVSPQATLDDISRMSGGRRVYKPLNKWNNSTTKGAVHLISPPNTLGAEIQLAADGTILRVDDQGNPVTQPGPLNECSRLGQAGRNSDPHIGQQVNQLVLNPPHLRVSLKNPVGLYIQRPQFGLFELPNTAPAGARPEEYWRVVRGQGEQVLHAVYEVPSDQGFTVGDITINGFQIEFASQICEQFQIQLVGQGITRNLPAPVPQPCRGSSAALSAVEPPSNEDDIEGMARMRR